MKKKKKIKGDGRQELLAFRQWVQELSYAQLTQALHFSFQPDSPTCSSQDSHEWDLLEEMVRLQSPPMTPIHPRALWYRPATQKGATDGRNEQTRIQFFKTHRPRLFQLQERHSRGFPSAFQTQHKNHHRNKRRLQNSSSLAKYDVLARKFITPGGEILSVGCTQEQQDADRRLTEAVQIHFKNEGNPNHTSRGCFLVFQKEVLHKELNRTKALLRILHVASRGKFLSLPHQDNKPSFCAPWLMVEQEWFSLPHYLASRFEVALWDSYTRSLQGASPIHEPSMSSSLPKDPVVLERIVLTAVHETLRHDVLSQLSNPSILVRDTLLFQLLSGVDQINTGRDDFFLFHGVFAKPSKEQDNCVWRTRLEAADSLPLTDVGTDRARVRRCFYQRVQQALATELQKSLENTVQSGPPSRNAKQSKKKHKKKRKKKTVDKVPDDEEKEEKVEEMVSPPGPPLRVNVEESMERTNTFVAVWKLLDEIMETVFDQVGLNNIEPEPVVKVEPQQDATLSTVKLDTVKKTAVRKTAAPTGVVPAIDLAQIDERQFPPLSQLPKNVADAPWSPQRLFSLMDSGQATRNDQVPLESNLFGGLAVSQDAAWNYHTSLEGWENARRQQNRERSLLADLFLSSGLGSGQTDAIQAEVALASSTAASIASSSDNEDTSVALDNTDDPEERHDECVESTVALIDEAKGSESTDTGTSEAPPTKHYTPIETTRDEVPQVSSSEVPSSPIRSPLPPAPSTPPPTLSPILVSLADLKSMRSLALPEIYKESPKARSLSNMAHGSLPGSPAHARSLTPSWSREDLRIASLSDDKKTKKGQQGRLVARPVDTLLSYSSVAAKSVQSSKASVDKSSLEVDPRVLQKETERCARSEAAIETHEREHSTSGSRLKSQKQEDEDVGMLIPVKDGSTTLASSPSLQEPEELVSLREERNSFRDMCLTLGAEVAKLKNLLAAQSGSSVPSFVPIQDPLHFPASQHPDFRSPYFQGLTQSSSVVAMSDAGVNRGDHDSAISEDGTDMIGSQEPGRPRSVHVRRQSSGVTVAGSDISVDQSATGFRPWIRDLAASLPVYGLHSRLTQDVSKFLKSISAQLQKQDNRKTAAVGRLTRLVTAVWPRAQVKIYGSHVTGLCLPSSDLDFVVCLPAVHKNAPAVTPGVLEGRNAINESSQKFLARKLKHESWIDSRSIKLIERTVVPIVKVSTKDTKARTLQLDISFDGPEHHGLAAIELVTKIMQDLPMIQPLVLILKQFLLDRGLLTAYTGGLSSYCLFLMVARFLQEQPSTWDDCGSLLMAFLDFYGNSFDPRQTGISVARRQYFSRPNYTRHNAPGQMWPMGHPQHVSPTPSVPSGRPDYLRRHSFTENDQVDAVKGSAASVSSTYNMRPPRFQSISTSPKVRFIPENEPHGVPSDQSGRPYTFDPLFVEDPLSAANNVGRNAFRIFQVQRAFSDAHRALLSSLEWDLHSAQDLNDGSEYPLLNCLLHSEDMFYDLEDNR